MNGQEHYTKAQALLGAAEDLEDSEASRDTLDWTYRAAQVHATLALADWVDDVKHAIQDLKS